MQLDLKVRLRRFIRQILKSIRVCWKKRGCCNLAIDDVLKEAQVAKLMDENRDVLKRLKERG